MRSHSSLHGVGTVDLLIKNGLIITMDKDRRIITDGSVAIDGGRIVSVKRGRAGRGKSEKVIDARGKIIMPGLICSHTHLHGLFLHSTQLKIEPPSDLVQIQQRAHWPVEETITKDDAYAGALFSCLQFLKTGVTLFAGTISGPNLMPGVLDKVALAVERSKIRGIIAFEATERRTHAEGAKGARENERFIRKVKKERIHRVQGMFSINASSTVSDELLWYTRELANRYKVPVTSNASEGLADVYHNYEYHGKRTIERLNDTGLLGSDVVLAHSVHVNDDELKIIKKRGAKVSHNPMSNMLNAVGVAPVMKMLSMEIPVGLGDDGYFFDGFENIRATYLLQKVATHSPRALSPMETLEMATIKGAELYGLQNELGSIEHGKLADVIILNPAPAPIPLRSDNVAGHIVNAVGGRNVETVIVGGNIIMVGRKIQTMDEAEVAKMAKKSTEKIWQKLGLVKGR